MTIVLLYMYKEDKKEFISQERQNKLKGYVLENGKAADPGGIPDELIKHKIVTYIYDT